MVKQRPFALFSAPVAACSGDLSTGRGLVFEKGPDGEQPLTEGLRWGELADPECSKLRAAIIRSILGE